ncbi:hypothetical protein ACTFIY_011095 [Dictyostelium cf. discoideum]
MNKSIIFLLFTLISFVFSQQLFEINYYQYEKGQCDGSQDGSGSLEACGQSSNIVSTAYAKFDECLLFNGGFSRLSLVSSNTVNYTVFYHGCDEGIQQSEIIEIGSCFANCQDQTAQNSFSISIIDESSVVIPNSNSFATIYYGGDCNGDWKSNFTFIEFMDTNICVNQGVYGSLMLSCNPNINQLTIHSYDTQNCENQLSATEVPLSLENCNFFNDDMNMALYCN